MFILTLCLVVAFFTYYTNVYTIETFFVLLFLWALTAVKAQHMASCTWPLELNALLLSLKAEKSKLICKHNIAEYWVLLS